MNPFTLIALVVPRALFAKAEPTAFDILAEKVKSIQTKKMISSSPLRLSTSRKLQTSTCGTNCCTLCAKGLIPTFLDATIDLGDFAPDQVTTMTCSDGKELVKTFSADDDSCPMLQMVGFAFCGCPEPPVLANVREVCTLCSDGLPVPEPNFFVDMGNDDSISCGLAQLGLGFLNVATDNTSTDVASGALSTIEETAAIATSDDSSYDTSNIDTCGLMQNSIGVLCGCANRTDSTADGCKICGSSATLTNPDHIVDAQVGLTCGAGARQASFIPAHDAFCAYIQAEAIIAGCKCEEDTADIPENDLSDKSAPSKDADNPASAAADNTMIVTKEEEEPELSGIAGDGTEDDGITSSSAFISIASPMFSVAISLAFL